MIIKNSMKNIYLTKDKYTIVDDEDYKYLNQWKWRLHSKGYAYRNEKRIKNHTRKGILMHRQIMKLNSQKEIDHINRNKLDNRKNNLRISSSTQNHMNKEKSKNNTSGYKGITYDKRKNKWMAQIQKNKKNIFIGYFNDKKSAATAYNRKAKELFNNFAFLNKII